MSLSAVVLEWDVSDGDILGALIQCPHCPCQPGPHGTGCGGDRILFRPYKLPGGSFIDLYRDADLLINVLDRDRAVQPSEEP